MDPATDGGAVAVTQSTDKAATATRVGLSAGSNTFADNYFLPNCNAKRFLQLLQTFT
jgi:hypothetical protein